jgi:hypothetical protein
MWIGHVGVEPRLHELSSSEGREILGGKFEPFAVLAAILKTPVPVFLNSRGVIRLNRVDDLRSLATAQSSATSFSPRSRQYFSN